MYDEDEVSLAYTYFTFFAFIIFCFKSWVGKDVSLDDFNHSMSFFKFAKFLQI